MSRFHTEYFLKVYLLPFFQKLKEQPLKKNRAAFSLSIPKITAVEIVAPEREIPGSIAMACETPISIASFIPTCFDDALALSAKNNSTPVISSMLPTNVNAPPKSASTSSLNNTPTNAAGIIESTIFKEN